LIPVFAAQLLPHAVALSCVLTHEKKTFFSYQRLTRSGGVGQGRAILRAAQRAKRLDGRRSGGYFATGAPTARVRLALAMFSQPFSLQPLKDFFVTDVGGSGSLLRKRAIVRCAALRGFSLRLTNQIQATKS
jgi:hypothetical protein